MLQWKMINQRTCMYCGVGWVTLIKRSRIDLVMLTPIDKTLLKNQEVRDIIENLARVTGGKGNK